MSLVALLVTPNNDILVSAHNSSIGLGSVYLLDGTDGSLLLEINNPTLTILDSFGYSFTSTPNGDILVGAPTDDTGAIDAGSVYLFDGTDGSLLLEINNPTLGEYDRFGYSVASTSNGDILVGTYLDDTGAIDAGSVYLFDGTDGRLLSTINNPTPESGDEFGYSIAGITNDNILVSAWYDNIGIPNAGSVYLFKGITSNSNSSSTPIITSLLADDPDDLDSIYSRDDTITITFDSDTDMPGGTGIQTRAFVDNLFTFSESLGTAYRGEWTLPDTFIITINNENNAGPPVINNTTVTPAEITPILSADGTSAPSYITSPALSGDFGESISSIIQTRAIYMCPEFRSYNSDWIFNSCTGQLTLNNTCQKEGLNFTVWEFDCTIIGYLIEGADAEGAVQDPAVINGTAEAENGGQDLGKRYPPEEP